MNKKRRTALGISAVILTLTAGIFVVYAQIATADRGDGLINENGNTVIGTWVAVVTHRDCATDDVIRSFPVLNSFHHGGTMTETGSSLARRGTGLGTWDRVRGNSYSSVFIFLRSNADGTPAGYQKIQRSHTLNVETNSLTTEATFENFDVNGTFVSAGCATEVASRLTE